MLNQETIVGPKFVARHEVHERDDGAYTETFSFSRLDRIGRVLAKLARQLLYYFGLVIVTRARFEAEYWKLDTAIIKCGARAPEYAPLFAARTSLSWILRPTGTKSPSRTVYEYLLH